MSINELVIRGSTSISLHERFTSLRRSGGSSSQGQSGNDSVNPSGYNGNEFEEDPSPGPALRGATSAPQYTPTIKMEPHRRGGFFRSGAEQSAVPPQPYSERYNPEQPQYQPPLRRDHQPPYNSYSNGNGYDLNRPNYTPYSPGYARGYQTPNYIHRRTPAVEAALRLKRRSLKQRLGVRQNNFDNSSWHRNNTFGGNYLKNYGNFRHQGNQRHGRARWNTGRWIRGGGARPRSRSVGRWGSTASLSSDGMGKVRRSRSNSFSGRRMGWNRGGRRGRGRGRGGWRSSDGKPPTKEDLDQQIDSYMASSKNAMDKELDSYMNEATAFK